MSEEFWKAMLATLPAILMALAAFVAALASLVATWKGNRKIEGVRADLNGRLTELMAAAVAAAHAEGVTAGAERERGRQGTVPPPPGGAP